MTPRAPVERRIYGDKNVVGHADAAYEALRAINHLTIGGAMPAPLVYDVLGNLKCIGHLLPQALHQISAGLYVSLAEYDVYEHDGRDPSQSVADALACLTEAGELAAELGRLLEAAQGAIAGQGHS